MLAKKNCKTITKKIEKKSLEKKQMQKKTQPQQHPSPLQEEEGQIFDLLEMNLSKYPLIEFSSFQSNSTSQS